MRPTIRRPLDRFRMILPPLSVLAPLLALLYPYWNLARPMACLIGFGYGIYRVTKFHPRHDCAYRAWLAQSPWILGKPLPRGPVSLVPEDLLILAGLLLAHALGQDNEGALSHLAAPGICFLAGYLGSLFFVLSPGWELLALAYGLAFCLWILDPPRLALTAMTRCYRIGLLGLTRSLNELVWAIRMGEAPAVDLASDSSDPSIEQVAWETPASPAVLLRILVGWPLGILSPPKRLSPDDSWPIRLASAALLAGLAGCWSFALLDLLIRIEVDAALIQMVVALMSLSAILVTIQLFMARVIEPEYGPPTTMLGRIASLRLILPGWDQVWVGCLMPPLAACGLAIVLNDARVGLAVSLPASASLFVFLSTLFAFGNAKWHLTGDRRILHSRKPRHVKGVELIEGP